MYAVFDKTKPNRIEQINETQSSFHHRSDLFRSFWNSKLISNQYQAISLVQIEIFIYKVFNGKILAAFDANEHTRQMKIINQV